MAVVRDLGQDRELWVGQDTLGKRRVPEWEGARGRGHGAMVKAGMGSWCRQEGWWSHAESGRVMECCRTWEHGAMVRARLKE